MKNKKFQIITSLVILLPMVVGLILWNRLPEELPTHFGFGNQPDGWGGKGFAVFGMPLMLLAVHWLCIWGMKFDKQNHGHNEKVRNLVLLVFPMISVVMALMVYGTALELELRISTWMMGMVGVLFLALGNYLPKCKRNSTLGIKLKWTLCNEENWNKTHRFGGKVWVLTGVMFLIAGLLPYASSGRLLPGLILLPVVLPTLYSYGLYKKQVKEGRWTETPVAIKGGKWAIAALTAVLILVLVLMFSGSIRYDFGETAVTVEASFYEDIQLSYDRIDRVEFRGEGVDGVRVWGYGSAKLLLGTFENQEFGQHLRYTYTGDGPCVVIYTENTVLVLGGETTEETVEIYNTILDHIGE